MTLDEYISALISLRSDSEIKNIGQVPIIVRYPVGDTEFYLQPDTTKIVETRGNPVVIIDVTGYLSKPRQTP